MGKTIYFAIIILLGMFSATSCNWFSGIEAAHSTEKVEFISNTFKVSGELLFPKGNGKFPLVIMVHGDGPGYMNYFITIKKTFLNAGYAVLMWDKPGYGKSKGKLSSEHLQSERAEILLDAISEMKKHPKILEDKIGVWGISQAGYIIPRALNRTNDIAFMIMVGCPGEIGIYQTAYQIQKQLECEGYSEEEAREAEDHFIKIFEAESFEEYIKHAKPLYDNPVQRELGFVSALWDKTNWKPISKERETLLNPMDIVETVAIPALVFYGEKDTQVDPIQGKEAYQKAFQKSGNINFRIEIISNSDHNIILCETGSMKERRNRSGEGWRNYAPEYLQIMEDWLIEFKKVKPSKELLAQYNKQTAFTDPGAFAYLFEELPKSDEEICMLIKKQLIHPKEAADMPNVFPKDKLPEDGDFPTVSDMLRGLVKRNNKGLTMDRLPKDRLLVACYHHGLLLASILRHQGKSVRLRAGFARYYEEQVGVRFSHVVCEVWNAEKEQWEIIDPDRNIQNVAENKFEYPANTWLNYINDNMPEAKYLGSIGQGENVYIHSLLLDMDFILGNERKYWHTPEFIFRKDFDINSLEEKQVQVLNQIAEYMVEPETKIDKLQKLYNDNPFVHEHNRSIENYYEKI